MSLWAMSLPSIECRGADAAEHIDSVGYGLEVRWIDAPSVPTEMVNFEPLWDHPMSIFVGPTMGSHTFVTADLKQPIASSPDISCPSPAVVLAWR